MRILFLSPFVWDSAYRGRYYHFFHRLSTRGHRVTVLEPRLSEEPVTRSQPHLQFARPRRPVDAWGGAAEAIRSIDPDVVLVTAPPSLARLADRAWWTGPPGGRRPLLVFDFSEEGYLQKLEAGLGPAGFVGRSLGKKTLAALARRADLVTASTDVLRRELPAGAILLANPSGARWGQAPVSGRTPAIVTSPKGGRRVMARNLAVAVLGPVDVFTLKQVAALASRHPELGFTLHGSVSDEAQCLSLPASLRLAAPAKDGRLVSRLTRADVGVIPAGEPDTAKEMLLVALSAGCPVLAGAGLRSALSQAARAADLTSADLAYFNSFEDLGEKLLRFSLTIDPAHSRVLEAKAERLRWASVSEAFEETLVHLLNGGSTGAVER